MKVSYKTSGNILSVHFELEEGEEAVEERRIYMAGTTMEIRLPDEMRAADIHHDHLALITVLSVHPFVSNRLVMDLIVSNRFADILNDACKYDLEFRSKDGVAYASAQGRPCLAFSGGVDSTAALMLMSDNTVCVWLDRPDMGKRTIYDKSAAKHTMEFASNNGYEVYKIYCDVEHLRSPVGFPVDLSSGIAAIAVSSLTGGDSIAYGMVMESAYRTGHTKFRDYPRSLHFNTWGPAFAAAGIPLFLPVGGISEVGTSTIVLKSKFNGEARSCIRGKWPEQCNNCWKCFRKTMVDNRILGNAIGDSEMKNWVNVREVKYKLTGWPVSHENVLSWALKNPHIKGGIVPLLLSRLEGSTRDLESLEKWYPPSIELVPTKYQQEFRLRVADYLTSMSDDEMAETESLDISSWLESKDALAARSDFDQYIDSLNEN